MRSGLVDEQFLTLAPQIAGRDAGRSPIEPGHGEGVRSAQSEVGALTDVRRGDRHLFLRYSFRGVSGRIVSPGRSARACASLPIFEAAKGALILLAGFGCSR